MLTEKKLSAAIFEAERFLERATHLKETGQFSSTQLRSYEGKDAASLKRSSMDLTNALTELRRTC